MAGGIATLGTAVRPATVVLAVLGTLLFVRWRDRRAGSGPARPTLLFGVPWGTALTVVGVALVYLLVQGGLAHRYDPLVVPFRAYSYRAPVGVLTAPFAHRGYGHLLGNLVGTVVFGAVVESVWGHYPRRRGAQAFASLRTNPYARVLAVPAGAVVVGLATALVGLGPFVGFSGVVFALAGAALVARPLAAIVAVLVAQVAATVRIAVSFPQTTATLGSQVAPPWWAEVAIQVHAVGIVLGAFVGYWLVRRRSDGSPTAARIWVAVLAFGTAQGLWAVFVPVSGGRFVLLRWVGVPALFVLATLVAVGGSGAGRATDSDESRATTVADRVRSLFGSVAPDRISTGDGFGPDADESRLDADGPRFDADGWTRAARALLVVALVGMALPGVAYNAAPVGQDGPPNDAVHVGDYAVTYAEDVPDGYVTAPPDVGPFGPPDVTTSGVVVTSERRGIWRVAVERARLSQQGHASVLVGGIGWRERVAVDRVGWRVAGNRSVYAVVVRPPEGAPKTVFRSGPSTARPLVDNRTVRLAARPDGFAVAVLGPEGAVLDSAPVPGANRTTAVGGLRLRTTDGRLQIVGNGTRVTVARQERDG